MKWALCSWRRAQKEVIKFHYYNYEIIAGTVIENSYKNVQNCYQIVKITVYTEQKTEIFQTYTYIKKVYSLSK